MDWIKPDWPVPDNVHAAVTLRSGGVSQDAFASLNPALHVKDLNQNVLANRRIIKSMLQLPNEPVWLQQVHGTEVVKADQVAGRIEADGSYTDQRGVVCAVMTADCLPLLIVTEDGSLVAAIHAGWRGLQAGIVEQACKILDRKDLRVWLGPAIGAESFEVGSEVKQAFTSKSADFAAAFREQPKQKWLADIYQLAKITLAQLGIDNVYGGHYCTVSEPDRFYSYRRDGETGRMATLIWRD